MVVATFACRQLVGIGDDPPQGPTASTDAGAEGGFTYGQGDCATCVTTSCGPQATACAGNASCSGLETCMSGCGTDPTCRAQCGVDYGLGNDGVTPLFEACLAMSCATECNLTCGGLSAVFPPATALACQSCIVQGPCADVTACAQDARCQTALRCQYSSPAPDVQQGCAALAQDARGASLLMEGEGPIAKSCPVECSWGGDWSCVGKVGWPPARLDPLEVTVSVYDAYSGQYIDNATVTLCNDGDPICTPPLKTDVTDDAGTAVLDRSSVPLGLAMYADISGSGLVSMLQLDVVPVSQPQFAIDAFVASPMDLTSAAQGIGVTLDPNAGQVTVLAVDCRGGVAPHVRFSMLVPDASPQVYYFANNVPSTTATETDGTGLAVFANVPALPARFTIIETPVGLGRASSNVPFFVRDGGYDVIYAAPTP
jgi:hypothetical protein